MADLGRLVGRRKAHASMEGSGDHDSRGPSSEVLSKSPGDVRSLTISTGLSGSDARSAWVTVSDARGTVYFEGQPADDGTVAVYVQHDCGVDRVRVLLETVRSHRQAEVRLADDVTEYVFD